MKKFIILFVVILTASSFNLLNAKQNDEVKSKFKRQTFERLNLTEEQKDKIADLKLQHRKKMIDLKAELEKSELALEELKNSGNFSRDSYIGAVEQINEAKNSIAVERANHQMDVYNLLDDNQKEVWLKMQNRFEHGKRFFGEHRGMRKFRNFN